MIKKFAPSQSLGDLHVDEADLLDAVVTVQLGQDVGRLHIVSDSAVCDAEPGQPRAATLPLGVVQGFHLLAASLIRLRFATRRHC